MYMEEEGVKSRRLNDEWIQTVDAVRLLPGFEDFTRPKSISKLSLLAARGPVVVLNAVRSSCHALISQQPCRAIVSPSATFNSLDTLANRGFASNSADRLFGRLFYEKDQSPDDQIATLLRGLWKVLTLVIQSSSLQVSYSMHHRPAFPCISHS
jgi:hypothetical protein